MRVTGFRAVGITWAEIEAHEPIMGERFAVTATRRVSDASASGDGVNDFVVIDDGVESVEFIEGLARLEKAEDEGVRVMIRTPKGEWEGWLSGSEGMDLPERISFKWVNENPFAGLEHARREAFEASGIHRPVPGAAESNEEAMRVMADIRATQLRWHAALLTRQSVTRATAVRLPRQAAPLMGMARGGREAEGRLAAIGGLRTSSTKALVNGRPRELVTVDVVLPPSSKAGRVRVRGEPDAFLFSMEPAVPREEIHEEIGKALLRRVGSARGMQTVLAGMSVIHAEGGIQLEGDGEVPKAFRLAVMELMGMPSRRASKRQREAVTDALHLLMHAEIEVKPHGPKMRKGSEYFPLLVRTSFHDAPGTGERRGRRLKLNDDLVPDMAGGTLWRIPRALMQLSDEADLDGLMRLLGFRLAFRLGMGTGGHEKLETFLVAAGLGDWARRVAEHDGGREVVRRVRAALGMLRALPAAGLPAQDVAGGTEVEGERIEGAIVHYRNPPAWTHSSPAELVADMSRHVRHAPNRRGRHAPQVLHEDTSAADSRRSPES